MQGAPPSWTCPRKILREPPEHSPLPPLLPLVRVYLFGQSSTCRGLGRPPPPLSRCARTPLPRPDAPTPARKAAQPPATPQVTQAFRSVRPARASSTGSPRVRGRDDGEPGPRVGGGAGQALSGHLEPGSWWAPGAGTPVTPVRGRACPRARRSFWSSLPRRELPGVPSRVCSAAPSPPPRRNWADRPQRRPLSLLRFPAAADHPRGIYPREPRRLAAHEPRSGTRRPPGRVWP